MGFFLCMTHEDIPRDKYRSKFKYLASKKLSRHLKHNRPQIMGSGFIFHVFAERFSQSDGIRTIRSIVLSMC